jgi:hypothetical protein
MMWMYDILGNITDAANTQVAWLSNFAERNPDSKKLKYKHYNDLPTARIRSVRVREVIKQHHTAQQRKTQATKELGDLWQHYPEIQEILRDSSRCQKTM